MLRTRICDVYDIIASKYECVYSQLDEVDIVFLDEFIHHLDKGSRVLDIGCGIGTYTYYMYKCGLNVTGIDFSDGMLAVAREKHHVVQFENMDIMNMSALREKFDGVVASYVLNHFSHADLCLISEYIDTITKPGGYIYIAIHEGRGETMIHDPIDSSLELYYHFFDSAFLTKIFIKFDIINEHRRSSLDAIELSNDKLFLILKKK